MSAKTRATLELAEATGWAKPPTGETTGSGAWEDISADPTRRLTHLVFVSTASVIGVVEDVAGDENILEETFIRLRDEWKTEAAFSSSVTEVAASRPYLEIVGMGWDVLPLILKDLGDDLDHWFLALAAITRENPVPRESRGDMDKMRAAWLDWGQRRGLVESDEGNE